VERTFRFARAFLHRELDPRSEPATPDGRDDG
jgi:hypothetical protein